MMACLQVGDPGRAGPMFERALADLETALGPNHPDVAHAAIDLGVLRLEQVVGGASRQHLFWQGAARCPSGLAVSLCRCATGQ